MQHIIQSYHAIGNMKHKRRNSGRKMKTGTPMDRSIARTVVGTPEKRTLSSSDLARDMDLNVSSRTVRRRLVESGSHGALAARKLLFRIQKIEKRLN